MDSNSSSKQETSPIISTVSSIIDTNVRIFRTTLYIAGGIVVLYVGRSLYISRVFSRIEDIPAHFIRKHVRLYGTVRNVGENGVLHVEHRPPLRLKIPYRPIKPVPPLPVHLACVEMTPGGLHWLKQHVNERNVWIRPLIRTQVGDHTRLYSHVEVAQRFRNLRVNDHLIQQGLCKVGPVATVKDASPLQLSADKQVADYVSRLVAIEAKAARKQVGVWKGYKPTVERDWTRKSVRVVKSIITSPGRAVKWLYHKIKG